MRAESFSQERTWKHILRTDILGTTVSGQGVGSFQQAWVESLMISTILDLLCNWQQTQMETCSPGKLRAGPHCPVHSHLA